MDATDASSFRSGARAYFSGIQPGKWDYSAFAQHCHKLPFFPKAKSIRRLLCRRMWDSCMQELLVDLSTGTEVGEAPASATLSSNSTEEPEPTSVIICNNYVANHGSGTVVVISPDPHLPQGPEAPNAPSSTPSDNQSVKMDNELPA